MNKVQLGCGLIRLGRCWGAVARPIPTETEAEAFLQHAVDTGIQFFDTAPAYGASERRLGSFLKQLPEAARERLTIATKCGEIWEEAAQTTVVDHRFTTLARSLDKSLELLGTIDILQIHKATPSILKSPDVKKLLTYARSVGIQNFGASISDDETARSIINSDELKVVQLPYNTQRAELGDALASLSSARKFIIINRPLNMGELVTEQKSDLAITTNLQEAYQFICQRHFTGVILTGTCNPQHLNQNYQAFISAYKT